MVMPDVHQRRDDREGPPTYRDPSFSEMIANAADLSPNTPPLRVVDLLSRHGKLAVEMQTIAPQHDYTAIALTEGELSKTPSGIHLVTADARRLDAASLGQFDRSIVRYGIKDFRAEEQPDVLAGIRRTLKDDGVLVIADMLAPEGAEEWLKEHHRHKQRLEGRDIERDGECNIPTFEEWLRLLQQSGFSLAGRQDYTSHVSTTDWVKGKQFGEDMEVANAKREEIDAAILSAPESAKTALNIRVENGVVKVDYPVVILRAIKDNPVYESK